MIRLVVAWAFAGLGIGLVLLIVVLAVAPPAPAAYPLVTARHGECAQLGQQVARYLDTGQLEGFGRGDAGYGFRYADLRTYVLEQQPDARRQLAIDMADGDVRACDQELGP